MAKKAIAAITTITMEQQVSAPLLPQSHDGFGHGKVGGRTWKC
jgi:hypothetical protein